MSCTKKTYKVSEINSFSRQILEREIGSVWVEGEISNFKHHSSGHMYFTLKDEKASLDAVMYRKFNYGLDLEPERGMKVLVRGTISIYVRGGRYQILVWEMEESGKGELEKKFLELKERLKKEGLFEQSHKKPVPSVPSLAGVVTSPTGAAIRDILNVIKRRFAGIKVVLFPCRVQGETAGDEIVNGIETLNRLYPEMDVMIVGRGGGSIEDLWPFNEEKVARAIFSSKIPVVSAVGHEVDFTISDFVSDLRAPTPSAAAEMITKERKTLFQKIDRLDKIMKSSVKNTISSLQGRIRAVSKIEVFKYPLRIVDYFQQHIDYVWDNLATAVRHKVEISRHQAEGLYLKIESLSPEKTMQRGFSVTTKNGKIITDVKNLKEDDRIETRFYKGQASSQIKKIKKGEKV